MSDNNRYNDKIEYIKRRLGKIVLAGILFLVVAVALFAGVSSYEKKHDEFQGDSHEDIGGEKIIQYEGRDYVFNRNVETFLIMGLDCFGKAIEGDSYNNDKQADLIVLFVFDRENQSYSAIHINRDTMTEVNILGVTGQKVGVIEQQIALSHTYGNGGIDSCRNVSVAVSRMMLGLPIDSYASITMDGIMELNDLVGGVTLTVNGDFSGFDDTLIDGEVTTLWGMHALNYVRSRQDGTNETRMVRQRQYMEALCQRSKEAASENEKLALDAISAMSDYTVTNCDVAEMSDFFDKLSTYEFRGVRTIKGNIELGKKYMEFKYDPEALKALIVELCCVPKK